MNSDNFGKIELNTIVSLAKRRGFIFTSGEIYGGLRSVRDYGPAGVELKRNIKDKWWHDFVSARADVVGVDTAILTHPQMMVASGHAESFVDELAECPKCKKRYRADEVDSQCPACKIALQDKRNFNLMFDTYLGAVRDDASRAYLRPETAQGIFVNFANVATTSRVKLPFGIGQIGKAFRNEITPGGFTFRMREFEQMELEFFCEPREAQKWFEYWTQASYDWFRKIGIKAENLRLREHTKDELPHYAANSTDIEYQFPWGWGELESIANRTEHDLSRHIQFSGKDLSVTDPATNERIVPYVVEPSMGADRTALAVLIDAYTEEQLEKDTRTVLKFHPAVAPFTVAVLPLSRSDKLVPTAHKVRDALAEKFVCQYDDSQSIGRRYRRQDELGTPLCVTIDFETIEADDSVTIRNRDTMQQVRVPIENLHSAINQELEVFYASFAK